MCSLHFWLNIQPNLTNTSKTFLYPIGQWENAPLRTRIWLVYASGFRNQPYARLSVSLYMWKMASWCVRAVRQSYSVLASPALKRWAVFYHRHEAYWRTTELALTGSSSSGSSWWEPVSTVSFPYPSQASRLTFIGIITDAKTGYRHYGDEIVVRLKSDCRVLADIVGMSLLGNRSMMT